MANFHIALCSPRLFITDATWQTRRGPENGPGKGWQLPLQLAVLVKNALKCGAKSAMLQRFFGDQFRGNQSLAAPTLASILKIPGRSVNCPRRRVSALR